ncbi:unnamed protein product [Ectocarpus sp. CCAP 1310/34]|nr:unnamed protein product [Ectocarpus sp. CCAP 1310/34]
MYTMQPGAKQNAVRYSASRMKGALHPA